MKSTSTFILKYVLQFILQHNGLIWTYLTRLSIQDVLWVVLYLSDIRIYQNLFFVDILFLKTSFLSAVHEWLQTVGHLYRYTFPP